MTDKNRIKLIKFSPDVLISMCSGKYQVVANELPIDVEVVETIIDSKDGKILIKISSSTFEPVLWGETIPMVDPVVVQKQML